jgi:class 3 adenylate cyclase
MVEERVTRKLAAILATDVVGYSRLMSVDERGTLAQMTAHLDEIFKPAITEHRGHVVKTTGDGLLAEFPSAVEAVECAGQIQTSMAERTKDDPEERRVVFRIGINVGDIITQDGDIFGDGVNVASRIEALADPGGVFISKSVSDNIAGNIDIPLEDLGDHKFKNIPRPVHVFRLLFDGAVPGPPLAKSAGHKPQWPIWAMAAVAGAIAVFALRTTPPPPVIMPSEPKTIAQAAEVKPSTKNCRMQESAVMISSVMPSAKYSCSGSPDILSNGSTAIDGLFGNAGMHRLLVYSMMATSRFAPAA